MSQKFTHGSLFSGIGGFDLGFERAGFETVWQVEIDPFCRKVLEKHWPNVRRFEDVRECQELPGVDVITGGFPCQDISVAGLRAGIEGARSGLWKEMLRIIQEIKPSFVAIENVAELLGNGMESVLRDLSESGLDAEWQVIPACAIGAPHIRERVWILAHSVAEPRIHKSGNGDVRAILDGDSLREVAASTEWPTPPYPCLCGVDDGIPDRVDRHEALGNALMPQIAEWIAHRIKEQLEARVSEQGS